MRISDWSSDVCSSDLGALREGGARITGFTERASRPSRSRFPPVPPIITSRAEPDPIEKGAVPGAAQGSVRGAASGDEARGHNQTECDVPIRGERLGGQDGVRQWRPPTSTYP